MNEIYLVCAKINRYLVRILIVLISFVRISSCKIPIFNSTHMHWAIRRASLGPVLTLDYLFEFSDFIKKLQIDFLMFYNNLKLLEVDEITDRHTYRFTSNSIRRPPLTSGATYLAGGQFASADMSKGTESRCTCTPCTGQTHTDTLTFFICKVYFDTAIIENLSFE